ncbi:MAG: 30S ribosomal protein S13 [Candidatus Thermoplasmatota archaeon]|nr:30S ribosomal protein S13 [Candidatus Thermoplasmatota archaeon]
MVRIANADIEGEKNLIHGLTSIRGIGLHMSTLIVEKTGLEGNKKVGNLSDKEIELLANTISDITEIAPVWMLNHRKDYDTGDDIHLIGTEIDLRLRNEINIMKKIRSYRGIRHERGLPVRGQRTRANNRTGLTLGVSKKREQK